jgi:tetratricopeptide (TPR) repeat protein
VAAFASQVRGTRERRVAQLGIREAASWETRLLDWLHPRVPDGEGIARSLQDALERRFRLVPAANLDSPALRPHVDRLYAFERPESLSADSIARVNQAVGSDAVFVARLARRLPPPEDPESVPGACADPARFELEVRMLSGRHADVASILMDVECIASGLQAAGTWNRRALGLYAALSLLLLFPLLRGWGTVVVAIKLPPRTRGFLRIKIGRKPEPVSDDKAKKRAAKKLADGRLRRSLRSLSRFQKNMAGRETTFRWIPARARPYYVTVRGPLLDAKRDEVIGHFLEEQRVRIVRGRPSRLVYDFCPSECAVEVSVFLGSEPARGARVALRGDPESIRYPRGGSAYFYVGSGTHTIVAGAADRATERSVTIRSVENAVPVMIDLADEEGLMIRGCVDAVEPYLQGDFEAAANALELAGETQAAHLMRGAHYQQQGELDGAADEFEAAGCLEEAAELRAAGRDLGGSATLFEQAGDFARAAETHRAAGSFADAARCYEQTYDWESAAECWEQAGESERVLAIHEKTGSYLEAAALASRLGDLDRALRNLQSVDAREPDYGDACRQMGEILAQRDEFDLAAQKLGEAVEAAGGERAPIPLQERHAELLECAGRLPQALEVLEAARRRDPAHEGMAERVARLRESVAAACDRETTPTERIPAAAAEQSRYEIRRELGRGGMGVVFEARDTRLGRVVALKRLPESLRHNRTAAQLFLREARAAAALNHRNIVTLYDAGEENGVYFITMELLEGMSLAAILDRRGSVSARDAARLGIQICAGLHYAAERRIVHRDIKPANLFFTRDKVVKIMDFGLAKTIEEVRRDSTVIGGTPYYMAPEQAAGDTVDARTDLYALGVTLFRLVTGTLPFREGDLAYHHRHTPPPDPREHSAQLSEAMARLILQLLEKDPDARCRDAAEVATRLQPIARGG